MTGCDWRVWEGKETEKYSYQMTLSQGTEAERSFEGLKVVEEGRKSFAG